MAEPEEKVSQPRRGGWGEKRLMLFSRLGGKCPKIVELVLCSSFSCFMLFDNHMVYVDD